MKLTRQSPVHLSWRAGRHR